MATQLKANSVEEMTPEEREAEHVRLLHEAIEATGAERGKQKALAPQARLLAARQSYYGQSRSEENS
jgi:hypothetical protein